MTIPRQAAKVAPRITGSEKPLFIKADPEHAARITVDIAEADYQRLKLVAAYGGRGVSLSRLVRTAVHEFLESLEDEADAEIVRTVAQDPRPTIAHADVVAALEKKRNAG